MSCASPTGEITRKAENSCKSYPHWQKKKKKKETEGPEPTNSTYQKIKSHVRKDLSEHLLATTTKPLIPNKLG
jgi:Zn-dependent peptidase ImmA (M78 family)